MPESECEEGACQAHRLFWSTEHGDERLSDNVCKGMAKDRTQLLKEDQLGAQETIPLCGSHSSQYILKRMSKKCSHSECCRFGYVGVQGLRLCWHHEEALRPRRSSRSRSREPVRLRDGEEDDAEIMDDRMEDVDTGLRRRTTSSRRRSTSRRAEDEFEVIPKGASTEERGRGRDEKPGDQARALLREMKGAEPEPVYDDQEPKRTRLTSRSPGHTPKSSIHRNLARLGLLDSPPEDAAGPSLLEEFFEIYSGGKATGLSESGARDLLGSRHNLT